MSDRKPELEEAVAAAIRRVPGKADMNPWTPDALQEHYRLLARAAIKVVLGAAGDEIAARMIRLGSLDDDVIRAMAEPFNDGIRAALAALESLGEGGSAE